MAEEDEVARRMEVSLFGAIKMKARAWQRAAATADRT